MLFSPESPTEVELIDESGMSMSPAGDDLTVVQIRSLMNLSFTVASYFGLRPAFLYVASAALVKAQRLVMQLNYLGLRGLRTINKILPGYRTAYPVLSRRQLDDRI